MKRHQRIHKGTNPKYETEKYSLRKKSYVMSGQTGCASKSAVAPARIEFQKFRRCPGPSHVQRNPIMYVVWGGKSNIFGARGPGRKKSRSQGVRSPDLLPKVGRGT